MRRNIAYSPVVGTRQGKRLEVEVKAQAVLSEVHFIAFAIL